MFSEFESGLNQVKFAWFSMIHGDHAILINSWEISRPLPSNLEVSNLDDQTRLERGGVTEIRHQSGIYSILFLTLLMN